MSSRPKLSDGRLHDPFAAVHRRHRFGARHGGSPGVSDLADHHLGNRLVEPGPVNVDPPDRPHTTLAPSSAISLAIPRPTPRPEPVDDRYLSFQIVGHSQ